MRRLSKSFVMFLVAAALMLAAGHATAQTYLIEVQAGGPGTVSPGTVQVPAGGSQTFTFTPSGCNITADVTVDDVSLGAELTEYTFTNVQSDHVLYVTFGPHSTTTALDVRPAVGQCAVPETLTATVPNADGGQVQFFNQGNLLGTSPLTAGVATYIVTSGLGAGSYTFSANYLGTTCFYGSTSPDVPYVVEETGPTPITLSLALMPRSIPFHGAPSSLITTLLIGGVASRQNGQVTFYDGATSIGTVTMSFGHSGMAYDVPTPGVHVITAVAQIACAAAVTSEPETLRVVPANTNTGMILTVTPAQVAPGEPVELSALLSTPYATGSIHFLDVTNSPVEIGAVPLVNGVATLTYTPLSQSNLALQARYDGDAVYLGCMSNQASLQVGSSTSLTLTITPTQADPGESVVVTAVTNPSSATGQVHFLDVTNNPIEIGAASLDNGVATFTYGPLSVSKRLLQAHYDGDGQHQAGESNWATLQIGASTSMTLAITPTQIDPGGSVVMTAAVDPSAASGTIHFLDVTNTPVEVGSASLDNGVAVFTYGPLSGSSRTMQARYDGDAVYLGCTSSQQFLQVGPVPAAFVDPKLWVTNGEVTAIAHDAGTIYIGGAFTQVGPATGSGVAIDANTPSARQPYPQVEGVVYVVAADGSGGWYLGGNFTAVRGQPRNNLAHLDVGGNLTPWNPNANGYVGALAVSGGTVYAGGGFTNVGGQPRSRIAALDAMSGDPTAWNPNANSDVNALMVGGGTVYAGGQFTSIGGQARSRIAALDSTTGAATPWNPNSNGMVRALAMSGNTIYAGGDFGTMGGQTRNRIAALDAATGAPKAWDPNANGSVFSIVVGGGVVYVGGQFTSIGGKTRHYIAALDAAFGGATAWNPDADGYVFALAMSGGTLFAGGQFTDIGLQSRNYIAALDAASGATTSWNPNASGFVFSLAASGSTVYAGGSFSSIGCQPRSYIAALDAATGAPTSWHPNASNHVHALAVSGGTVYAGGTFTTIGGQPRSRIAALDATSGDATAWNPNANGFVAALAVSGGIVYAGGQFTSVSGQPRNCIAAIDAASGVVTSWNPNASGTPSAIYALSVDGSTVYAGGNFTEIGGQLRNHIAALDAVTAEATPWDPNAIGSPPYGPTIYALTVSGGTVYVGGQFNSIGGQPRSNVAAIDTETGAATAWNPNVFGSDQLDGPVVYALAVNGGIVYLGGKFLSLSGIPRRHIAAVDATTGSVTTWTANAAGDTNATYVRSLAVSSGGTVYCGGQFTHIGGVARPFLAGLAPSSVPLATSLATPTQSDLHLSPNPTTRGTQVRYSVARAGRVRLEVLDVSGRVEETLADRIHTPGRYVVSWDGVVGRGRLAPGLHFVRLIAPDRVMVGKLAIVR